MANKYIIRGRIFYEDSDNVAVVGGAILNSETPPPPSPPKETLFVNHRSELLREPNLLIPGKKPIGEVKIDWSHPLTDKLKVCMLLHNWQHEFDLTGNAVHPHPLGQLWHFSPDTCELGRVIRQNNSTTNTRSYVIQDPFLNEVSIYTWAYMLSLNANSSVADADQTNGVRRWRFTSNADGSWGNLWWNGIIGVTSSNTVGANQWHKVWSCASDTRDEIKICLNGVTTTAAYTDTLVAQDYFVIGRNRNLDIHGLVPFFFMWNKYLSAEEMAALDADPYQFLIPA